MNKIIEFFKRKRNGWEEHTRFYNKDIDLNDIDCLVKRANELGLKGFSLGKTERNRNNEIMLVVIEYSYWKRFILIIKTHFIHDY